MDTPPPQGEIYNMTKRTLALAEDTNRMMHKMRRGMWWSRLFTLVWWAFIIALTGASYYYLLPYMQRAQEAYANFQTQAQKAGSLQQQVQDTLNQYLGGTAQ